MSSSDAMRVCRAGTGRRVTRRLPEISGFLGIRVFLHVCEDASPHFHAVYDGRDVSVDIGTLGVMEGGLQPRAMGLVMEWAHIHRRELRAARSVPRRGTSLRRIAPLA